MRACLLWISLWAALWHTQAAAQSLLPNEEGERVVLSARVEMPRARLSGLCVVVCQEGKLRAGLVNEFGFTALAFRYDPATGKVKLTETAALLDKWYIRRTLRRDLRAVMQGLAAGQTEYRNPKRGITYQFTPTPCN